MTAIWDEAFLKQRERDACEMALAAQSDEDWKRADVLLEQAISDSVDGFKDCQLPPCRRARRCVGNKPVCMPRCAVERGAAEQELFDEFYAWIQQERQDAAAEHRRPDVERVKTHRVHVEEEVEEEQVEDDPAPAPARDEPGRSSRAVPEPPRSAPSQPVPQPQLRQSEPPAAPPALPVLPAAKAAPPAPEISPEQMERVDRIWEEYVASGGKSCRPGPRIRAL